MRKAIFKSFVRMMASILTLALFSNISFAQLVDPTKNLYISGSNCQAYYGANRSDIQNTQYGAWNFNLGSPVWVTCPVLIEPILFQNAPGDIVEFWVNLKHNSATETTTTCYVNVADISGSIVYADNNSVSLMAGNRDFIEIGKYTIPDGNAAADYYQTASVSCYLAPNAFILGLEAYFYVP